MNLNSWRDDLKSLAIMALATLVGNGTALVLILWWRS